MAEAGTVVIEEGAAVAAPSPTEGSGLDLVHLSKTFPGGTVAVEDVNLHVDHGEYVVLLGPSGCGKTTTLRMIGGHEFPTSGDILLDGQSLVGLPPHKRPTTTVFQHFALFPHKSTLANVEFGLKMHGVPKEERRKQAFEALDMVGLTNLADRKPRALSGGQQHRSRKGGRTRRRPAGRRGRPARQRQRARTGQSVLGRRSGDGRDPRRGRRGGRRRRRGRGAAELGRLRDRLRRVPRGPREA